MSSPPPDGHDRSDPRPKNRPENGYELKPGQGGGEHLTIPLILSRLQR
ncbi:hypothetical protein [Prochlorothrix hollandica]|nr:hypothetical protein [Prochlorothrix hollandica]